MIGFYVALNITSILLRRQVIIIHIHIYIRNQAGAENFLTEVNGEYVHMALKEVSDVLIFETKREVYVYVENFIFIHTSMSMFIRMKMYYSKNVSQKFELLNIRIMTRAGSNFLSTFFSIITEAQTLQTFEMHRQITRDADNSSNRASYTSLPAFPTI